MCRWVTSAVPAGRRHRLGCPLEEATTAINPNRPLVMEDWAPYWNCAGGDSPLDRYAEVTPRTRGRSSLQRGQQHTRYLCQLGLHQFSARVLAQPVASPAPPVNPAL